MGEVVQALIVAVALVAVPVAAIGSPAHGAQAWQLVPDLTSEPATYMEVAPPSLATEGNRIVVTFSIHEWLNEEALLRIVNPDGDDVMHAVTRADGYVYITDGTGADGQPRPTVPIGTVNSPMHTARLDVLLEGDTYTAIFSGSNSVGPVTLRAFHPATLGSSADASHLAPDTASIHRVAHYPAAAAMEDFHLEPGFDGWTPHAPDGAMAARTEIFGHQSVGYLELEAGGSLEELTYLHAPVDGFGGRYVAEASARPARVGLDPASMPDHQAVLSGLSGSLDQPQVNWAVVMATVDGRPDRWSLFVLDADDHRTQVAPTWTTPEWCNVRVFVDEPTDTLILQLDGGSPAIAFEAPLSTSQWVATGDVWRGHDHPWWTGGGEARYDNLVVSPWDGPA